MTLEELENRIKLIEHDAAKEISLLKIKNFKLEVRFEALLRYFIWEGNLSSINLTVEKYQEAVNTFQTLNNKVQEINLLPSINEKVKAALDFNNSNKTLKGEIYGDDLGLKTMIENAGGTMDVTAKNILASLTCSKELTTYLNQFLSDKDKVVVK